jgi:Tol biopolymer transport system component
MSALGGSEKKIFDLHWRADYSNRHLSWSTDSQRLAFPDRVNDSQANALFELNLATGITRQITFPASPEIDLQPAYSPDGNSLAFVRDHGGGVNRIHILPLKQGAAPYELNWKGFKDMNVSRCIWTPDSRMLLFIAGASLESRLWAGRADGSGRPKLITSLGMYVYDTTISTTGELAAVYQHYDSDLYKLDLSGQRSDARTLPEPVANSTRLELNPKVSPDGRKLAFESSRSGYMEIWTVNIDGSNPAPLTQLENPLTGSPSWSHDGRRIVFDSRQGEAPRLYIIDAVMGRPQALTSENDHAVVPVWSVDDAWIYFSSDRSGNSEIWRIPSSGGHAEQITRNGGFAVSMSPDGKWIYYAADRARITELRAFNTESGQQTVVSSDVLRRNYAATRDGVYYVYGQTLGSHELRFTDRAGRTKSVFHFDKPVSDGLDISPDGHTLYFGQRDQDGTDLMLVNRFWR